MAKELYITIEARRTYVVASLIGLHVVGSGRVTLLKLIHHNDEVQIVKGVGAGALNRGQGREGTGELDGGLILNVHSRQPPKSIVVLSEGARISVQGRSSACPRKGVVVESGSRKGPFLSFLHVVSNEREKS